MSKNSNTTHLFKARQAKDDEFYTLYEDVADEVILYKDQLEGKIVYCNCDNPRFSNFFKYLYENFKNFKLNKLICTYYDEGGESFKHEITKAGYSIVKLKGNGDFRSDECVKLLKECDIVITNPPFSLSKTLYELLYLYSKDFLIIGQNMNVALYSIFNLIKDSRVNIGKVIPKRFSRIDGTIRCICNCYYWTTLYCKEKKRELITTKKYDKKKYIKYDNYDAIEVSRIKDIPYDYDGVMGVPITIMEYDFENRYEIIGITSKFGQHKDIKHVGNVYCSILSGKKVFKRMFIRLKEV